MKVLAAFLSLLLAGQAFGQPVAPSTAAVSPEIPLVTVSTEPITVAAPRYDEKTGLKVAEKAGGVAAIGGGGLMIYSLLISAGGPFSLAAGLFLLGGLTAYLAHRRLNGKEDFPPGPSKKPAK